MDTSLWIRAWFTTLMVIGMGGLIYLLAVVEIPESNQEHVWTLLGVIGTLTTQASGWWFASSKGSSDKTTLLKGGNA